MSNTNPIIEAFREKFCDEDGALMLSEIDSFDGRCHYLEQFIIEATSKVKQEAREEFARRLKQELHSKSMSREFGDPQASLEFEEIDDLLAEYQKEKE